MAWLSKCRAILVRYDKETSYYLGPIQLACALLSYRRQHRLLFRDSFLTTTDGLEVFINYKSPEL